MTTYILKRIVSAILVTIGVIVVVYLMLHVIAPSPGRAVLGLHASIASVDAWNREHGYDRPLVVQFGSYFWQLLHGNLGYSYKEDQPVAKLFAENAGRSAYLSFASLFLAIIVAMPVGIWQAIRRNKVSDYTLTAASFTLYSMPSFFLGLILIQVFALSLGWFPVEAAQQTGIVAVILNIHAMFLPIVTLAATNMAAYSRYMRSSALDNLAQDYIRLARAKGLSERSVYLRHLLRNSILPMVTLIGLSIPALLAGNIITEELYNYPGLGLLFFTALQNFDYPVLLALVLVGAIATVVGNLIADVALTVADPRIRL
ncbi:MAG: ABC transporter permease [Actinomycetota bacterium]|nr:ABC transporter permease [Actinomycetota bacterium]